MMNNSPAVTMKVPGLAEPLDNIDRLVAAIDAADVVSFDIFDTLFVRLVADPEDVFDLVGARFGIPGFRRMRQEAQQRAFVRMHERGAGEITLSGIYACMGRLPAGVSAATLEVAEYELELELTVPNPQLIGTFKKTAAHKPLVVTSDMYLPKSFFEDLFDKYELPRVPMFISADRDATKRDSGALFDLVAEEMGVDHGRLLHIGDNVVSDVQRAKERGLAAFHWSVALKSNRARSLGASLAEGMLSAGYSVIPPGSLRRMGYRYGGPMAMGFLQWIGGQSRTDNIDLVLFVSRDGYILDRMVSAGMVSDFPPHAYFPGSRVAFYLSAMTENNFDSYLDFLMSGSIGLAPFEVLERIGVSVPDDRVMTDLHLEEDRAIGVNDLPRLRMFLQAYRHEILKVCRRNRRGLHNILRELGARPGMRLAMIDVGWNGTTQEALFNALQGMWEVSLHGYYLALVDTPERERRNKIMPMKAMFNASQVGAETMSRLYDRRVGVEMMFSAPHDSVIGYESVPGKTVRVIEDVGRGEGVGTLNSSVIEIQDGMLEFCNRYCDLMSKLGCAVEPDQLAKVVLEFADLPAEECATLYELSNFDAWGSSRNLRLTISSYIAG